MNNGVAGKASHGNLNKAFKASTLPHRPSPGRTGYQVLGGSRPRMQSSLVAPPKLVDLPSLKRENASSSTNLGWSQHAEGPTVNSDVGTAGVNAGGNSQEVKAQPKSWASSVVGKKESDQTESDDRKSGNLKDTEWPVPAGNMVDRPQKEEAITEGDLATTWIDDEEMDFSTVPVFEDGIGEPAETESQRNPETEGQAPSVTDLETQENPPPTASREDDDASKALEPKQLFRRTSQISNTSAHSKKDGDDAVAFDGISHAYTEDSQSHGPTEKMNTDSRNHAHLDSRGHPHPMDFRSQGYLSESRNHGHTADARSYPYPADNRPHSHDSRNHGHAFHADGRYAQDGRSHIYSADSRAPVYSADSRGRVHSAEARAHHAADSRAPHWPERVLSILQHEKKAASAEVRSVNTADVPHLSSEEDSGRKGRHFLLTESRDIPRSKSKEAFSHHPTAVGGAANLRGSTAPKLVPHSAKAVDADQHHQRDNPPPKIAPSTRSKSKEILSQYPVTVDTDIPRGSPSLKASYHVGKDTDTDQHNGKPPAAKGGSSIKDFDAVMTNIRQMLSSASTTQEPIPSEEAEVDTLKPQPTHIRRVSGDGPKRPPVRSETKESWRESPHHAKSERKGGRPPKIAHDSRQDTIETTEITPSREAAASIRNAEALEGRRGSFDKAGDHSAKDSGAHDEPVEHINDPTQPKLRHSQEKTPDVQAKRSSKKNRPHHSRDPADGHNNHDKSAGMAGMVGSSNRHHASQPSSSDLPEDSRAAPRVASAIYPFPPQLWANSKPPRPSFESQGPPQNDRERVPPMSGRRDHGAKPPGSTTDTIPATQHSNAGGQSQGYGKRRGPSPKMMKVPQDV
ncbi:hypothetical protein HDU67_007473 [Dinochytrium kinnereticum]|nr:hypothetical protein HDU67_007473 [Dinochytrium kinnereticum]